MMFTDKKKYTRVAIQLLAFRRKPKKLRLFYRNKKLAIFKTRIGNRGMGMGMGMGMGNGKRGTGNGESLKAGIFKMGSL